MEFNQFDPTRFSAPFDPSKEPEQPQEPAAEADETQPSVYADGYGYRDQPDPPADPPAPQEPAAPAPSPSIYSDAPAAVGQPTPSAPNPPVPPQEPVTPPIPNPRVFPAGYGYGSQPTPPGQPAPPRGYAPYGAPPVSGQTPPPVYYPRPTAPPAPAPYTAPAGPKAEPNPRGRRGVKIVAFLLAAVILLVSGVSVGYLVGKQNEIIERDTPSRPSVSSVPEQSGVADPGNPSSFDVQKSDPTDEAYSYEDIVKAVAPSIVNITIYSPSSESGYYASGIIMDAKSGYVLTNDHIYENVPNAKFLITLYDGTEFHADFVSGDSRSDIAILKIQDPKGLKAATFCSESPAVGERVLTFGQSFGYADTVAEGIVSAVDRRVNMANGSYSEKYIQTTAAINPGNSGGALVNTSGQVVGVCSGKIATDSVDNICFAVPAYRALAVVESLQKNGKVVGRAKLGITYTEMGTVRAEQTGNPVGLLIEDISADSDLAGKGVAKGDVITHINDTPIQTSVVVLDLIEQSAVGDTVTLTVQKAGSNRTVTVSVKLVAAESSSSYRTQATDLTDQNDPFGIFENDRP